jgi:DNA-binding transcriptional ArsR family regulator
LWSRRAIVGPRGGESKYAGQIIELLASRGALSATDISGRFPISAPAISQHLKILRETRLVAMQKRKQQRIYQLNPQAMSEFEQWVRALTERWEARYRALDEILEVEKHKAKKGDKQNE